MIESIEINNFRCFQKLRVKGCSPINVIVGENGVGKTALMEAIFLALCSNPQKGVLLRQYRGNDPQFSGDAAAIVEALYAEFFYRQDLTQRPQILLKGSGAEARQLSIIRGRADVRIPAGAKSSAEAEILSPIIFEWTDAKKKKYRAGVKVSSKGIQFEGTGEDLGPNWFFYAAQGPVPARENADRFTALRKGRGDREFVRIFKEVFDWIEDISVESMVGAPVLSATVRGQDIVLPLTAVSGGVNRTAAILLAMAHQRHGIVMVDEIENGVFYTKHVSFCRAILRFAREYECQLFLSSHSQEWLRAFVEAAGKDVEDISLWRIERTATGPAVERFDGRTFKAGIEHGAEVRTRPELSQSIFHGFWYVRATKIPYSSNY